MCRSTPRRATMAWLFGATSELTSRSACQRTSAWTRPLRAHYVALRPANAFLVSVVAGKRFIGRPMPRLEDERLVRGAGQFTDDWTLPDQCYAAFVRSPHAHALVLAVRTSAAARAPGVLARLTRPDYPARPRDAIAHPAR